MHWVLIVLTNPNSGHVTTSCGYLLWSLLLSLKLYSITTKVVEFKRLQVFFDLLLRVLTIALLLLVCAIRAAADKVVQAT